MYAMDYNFIKNDLKSMINGVRVDKTALELMLDAKENSFILNHNIDAVSSLLKFLDSSSENIFVLNGFMGAGKTYVSECVLDFVHEDVLIFKNSYQEAINLDDVLLSLFKDFSVYHNEKKIQLPKIETNVFTDKINAYVKSCDVPMLFIFDSFEINLKSQDSQKDLLGFIDYLSHFEKVKIIICSRTFRVEDLQSTAGSASYALKSLSQDEISEFLKTKKIEGNEYEKEALHKVTRGHFLLLELSALYMHLTGLSLTSFTNEYKKSTKNFIDFLISKILATASDKFVKLLVFLATIRHGISFDFLIMHQLATSEDLEFLLQKRVVTQKYGKYYLKDYIKTEYLKSINIKSKMQVHKHIIDLYESELPLKPFERNLFLSRQTMRQEISYHLSRIDSLNCDLEKAGKTPVALAKDFNYLSYSRTSAYDENVQKNVEAGQILVSVDSNNEEKTVEKSQDKSQNIDYSNGSFLLVNQVKSDDSVKDVSLDAEQISDIPHVDDFEKEVLSSVLDAVPETIDDYIKIAQDYESAYNFASAILYYKKALSYKSDKTFAKKEPELYLKLADCHRKIQDYESAVKAYEKVYSIYLSKDGAKANDILLNIARMYSEVYKFDKAKEYYKRVLYSPNAVSTATVIRVYLDMAEVEDNSMDSETAIKYLQKALNEAEKITDVKILVECYFKYALLLDEMGNTEMATKYYLRCVQASSNPAVNTFMSSAYSNLAEISLDAKNNAAAKMYYELSIEADKKQNNMEGLYYSYSKLAHIYQKDNPEKAYELLVKALSAAKTFDNVNYAVAVYVDIGDYYLSLKNYKQALKAFVFAKRLANPHSTDGLYNKVAERINKMKNLLGEVNFMRVVGEMKKSK